MIKIIAFLSSLVVLLEAYKSGAPKDACLDMVPQHGAPIQSSRLPYTVTFDKQAANPNDIVTMQIKGPEGFQGFLMQVRDRDTDRPIGSFIKGNDQTKIFNCISDNDSITHSSEAVKNNLSVRWRVPANFKNTAIVYATIAKNGGTYWVKNEVGMLNKQNNRITIQSVTN